MQFWIHDVKFSAKLLWKNKAFAAAVVLYPGCLYCRQFRHLQHPARDHATWPDLQ